MRLADEHFVTLQGKQYVLYSGLIALAHEAGIKEMNEEFIQFPTKDNDHTAIIKAVAKTEDGRSFSGIGDANADSVGKRVAVHYIRLASTRAKARALRDLCAIGAVALEELSDGEESSTSPQERSHGQEGASPTPISQGRQGRSRDDELTPGRVPVGRANELIALLIKAGNKREEVGPYVWNAKPEAVEKKMNELKGRESKG